MIGPKDLIPQSSEFHLWGVMAGLTITGRLRRVSCPGAGIPATLPRVGGSSDGLSLVPYILLCDFSCSVTSIFPKQGNIQDLANEILRMNQWLPCANHSYFTGTEMPHKVVSDKFYFS